MEAEQSHPEPVGADYWKILHYFVPDYWNETTP